MGWSLQRTVDPTEQPVSLPEVKEHLRVDGTDEDDLVEAMMGAAVNWVEEFCSRQLITATWQLTLDTWPRGDEFRLPRPPAASITSIKYHQSDGTTSTMPAADYFLDSTDDYGPHRVILEEGKSWPSEQLRRAAVVEVLYVAGYGLADDVPDLFKSGIRTVTGTLYEHRETEGVGTITALLKHSAEWLLTPYRVWRF